MLTGFHAPVDQLVWLLAIAVNSYHLIQALRMPMGAPLSGRFVGRVDLWSRDGDRTLAQGFELLGLTARELLLRLAHYYARRPFALMLLAGILVLLIRELS